MAKLKAAALSELDVIVKFPTNHFKVKLNHQPSLAFTQGPAGTFTSKAYLEKSTPPVDNYFQWIAVGNPGDEFTIDVTTSPVAGSAKLVDSSKIPGAKAEIAPYGPPGAAGTPKFQF